MNPPTLSIANDLTGTSVMATVAGDPGATHHLLYKLKSVAAWTSGASCVGDGTISQTGLPVANRLYEFIAYSAAGDSLSLPSAPVEVNVWPSNTAVEEQVAQKIAGYLDGLAGSGRLLSGGFSRFTREGLPDSPAHLSAVLFENDPEPADMDAGWYVALKQHVIVLFFQTPDGSLDAIGSYANNVGAAVTKTITNFRPWDNLIKDIQWEAPLSHPYGDSHYCRELAARVLYKFREDDPFIPG